MNIIDPINISDDIKDVLTKKFQLNVPLDVPINKLIVLLNTDYFEAKGRSVLKNETLPDSLEHYRPRTLTQEEECMRACYMKKAILKKRIGNFLKIEKGEGLSVCMCCDWDMADYHESQKKFWRYYDFPEYFRWIVILKVTILEEQEGTFVINVGETGQDNKEIDNIDYPNHSLTWGKIYKLFEQNNGFDTEKVSTIKLIITQIEFGVPFLFSHERRPGEGARELHLQHSLRCEECRKIGFECGRYNIIKIIFLQLFSEYFVSTSYKTFPFPIVDEQDKKTMRPRKIFNELCSTEEGAIMSHLFKKTKFNPNKNIVNLYEKPYFQNSECYYREAKCYYQDFESCKRKTIKQTKTNKIFLVFMFFLVVLLIGMIIKIYIIHRKHLNHFLDKSN